MTTDVELAHKIGLPTVGRCAHCKHWFSVLKDGALHKHFCRSKAVRWPTHQTRGHLEEGTERVR